jgi:hypothetical protein
LQAFVDHVAVTLHGEDEVSGLARLTPVASDGARPCNAWSTFAIEVVRKGRVAADAEHPMARSTTASSSMISSTDRIAIGSPQPGHRLCAPTSISDGVKSSTSRALSGAVSVGITVNPSIFLMTMPP